MDNSRTTWNMGDPYGTTTGPQHRRRQRPNGRGGGNSDTFTGYSFPTSSGSSHLASPPNPEHQQQNQPNNNNSNNNNNNTAPIWLGLGPGLTITPLDETPLATATSTNTTTSSKSLNTLPLHLHPLPPPHNPLFPPNNGLSPATAPPRLFHHNHSHSTSSIPLQSPVGGAMQRSLFPSSGAMSGGGLGGGTGGGGGGGAGEAMGSAVGLRDVEEWGQGFGGGDRGRIRMGMDRLPGLSSGGIGVGGGNLGLGGLPSGSGSGSRRGWNVGIIGGTESCSSSLSSGGRGYASGPIGGAANGGFPMQAAAATGGIHILPGQRRGSIGSNGREGRRESTTTAPRRPSWRAPVDSLKAHPTAVSSYGTTTYHQPIPPHPHSNTTVGLRSSSSLAGGGALPPDDSSMISSNFSGSTYSGLYTKSRMATTRDGFQYMPSLHLSKNNSGSTRSLVGGGGTGCGPCGGVGVSGGLGGVGGFVGSEGRFQNSYLLRGIGGFGGFGGFMLNGGGDGERSVAAGGVGKGSAIGNSSGSSGGLRRENLSSEMVVRSRMRMRSVNEPVQISPMTIAAVADGVDEAVGGPKKSFFASSREVQEAVRQDERVRQWRDQQYSRSLGQKIGVGGGSGEDDHSVPSSASGLRSLPSKQSTNMLNCNSGQQSMIREFHQLSRREDDQSVPSNASGTSTLTSKPSTDVVNLNSYQEEKGDDNGDTNYEYHETTQLSPHDRAHLSVPSITNKAKNTVSKQRRRKYPPKAAISSSRDGNDTRFFPVTSPHRAGVVGRNSGLAPIQSDSNLHANEKAGGTVELSPSVMMSPRYNQKEPTFPSHQNSKQPSTSPILSPPRRLNRVSDDAIQSKQHSDSRSRTDSFNNEFPTPILNILSPPQITPELATPTRSNFTSTCLAVLPRITSAIAITGNDTYPETPPSSNDQPPPPPKGASHYIPQAVLNWAPLRSPSSLSSTLVAAEGECSQWTYANLVQKAIEGGDYYNEDVPTTEEHSEGRARKFCQEPLETWENCLYVRAEGARTGRICLTSTHVMFIYEDEVSDALLHQNGWNRGTIDDFLDGKLIRSSSRSSSSREPTPVNVPPDESGEGGGVELIGTHFGESPGGMEVCAQDGVGGRERSGYRENMIGFVDMFQCGFEEIDPPVAPVASAKSEESGGRDVKGKVRSLSYNTDVAVVMQSSRSVDNPKMNTNTYTKTNRNRNTNTNIATTESSPLRGECITPVPTTSCSSSASSAASSVCSVEPPCDGRDGHYSCGKRHQTPGSFCEESYEEMMNKCIIRAIEEEARRHLHELDYDEDNVAKISAATSFSEWEKEQYMRMGMLPGTEDSCLGPLDSDACPSVFGAQTNISSFSELDMEIDPNEERRLYITSDDDKDSKQSYIGIKWPLTKLAEIYPRRYMMRDVALEIFGPSPSTASMHEPNSSQAISSFKGNENVDVLLGELSTSSMFLVIPDSENVSNSEEDNALSRFRGKRKIKTRRDSFVQVLKDQIPQLNFAFLETVKMAQSQNTLLGNIPHDGIEGMLEGGLRRAWAPTLLFRRRSDRTDPLYVLTRSWRKGHVSNFDYLMRLNSIAGRSIHDPGNYPVMPWVLSNYQSDTVPDFSDKINFRDMSKPMGALSSERLQKFVEKYTGLCGTDTAIPPFMYGSHYSNIGGVVLHYLVRNKPFAGLHRQLQGGHFDLPDRLFRSVAQTWETCSHKSATEVKELTPEWYSNPAFLKNSHNFNLGTSVNGSSIGDVILPPWADNDPCKFIKVMRDALESDVCSAMLPSWIDLIFGFKQRGPEAETAHNVFYHLTYYEPDDLAKIEDATIRTEIELHISDFGQCPSQLFLKPHPQKKSECVAAQSKAVL